MNERIQELIAAYLHRGSTPEQEQELFEACSHDPSTAELLRQHLILSLKLHTMRDTVEVPTELHNSLLRRINAMEAEPAPVPQGASRERSDPNRDIATATPRRFGWAHLFGTGLAGVAAVLLLTFWLDDSGPDLATRSATIPRDTVTVVRVDTLTRVQQIERPVYIVRELPPTQPAERIPAGVGQDGGSPGFAGQPTDATAGGEGLAALVSENNTPLSDTMPDESAVEIAELRPVSSRVAKTQNFLAQYTSMLVSVESVSLSAKDRLH